MNDRPAGPRIDVPRTHAEMAPRQDHEVTQRPVTAEPSLNENLSSQAGETTQNQSFSSEQQPAQQEQQRQQPISPELQDLDNLPTYLKPQPEEMLYEWTSDERVYKQRRKQQFATIASIVVLLSLILFFANQFLPIGVVIAVGFVWYVMATTPPHKIKHQFSTYGYRVEGNLYYWEEMSRYWFTTKHDQRILHIEVERFPFHLTMLVGDASEEALKTVLSAVLIEQVPEKTPVERAASWLQDKIPIDIDA